MIDTCQNTDLIESIFFFFISKIEHFDLLKRIHFIVFLPTDFIHWTVCSITYISNNKIYKLGLAL